MVKAPKGSGTCCCSINLAIHAPGHSQGTLHSNMRCRLSHEKKMVSCLELWCCCCPSTCPLLLRAPFAWHLPGLLTLTPDLEENPNFHCSTPLMQAGIYRIIRYVWHRCPCAVGQSQRRQAEETTSCKRCVRAFVSERPSGRVPAQQPLMPATCVALISCRGLLFIAAGL